ncbi:MAG: hypothetical protein H6893_09370 [Brucellaceae bacterium]|nr:hypothetical protein [Brucellaceae bacterium]
MDVFTGLVCAGIFLWSLPKVWDYVTFMEIERTAYMRIRFDYVFAIYIPFAIWVSLRCLLDVWHAIRGTHPKCRQRVRLRPRLWLTRFSCRCCSSWRYRCAVPRSASP